jgi:hypothetical protein
VTVSLSPALPSTGLIVSIFGATQKQAGACPAVSAALNLGFQSFGFAACGSAVGATSTVPQGIPTATMRTIVPVSQLDRITMPVSWVRRPRQLDN